MPSLPVPFWIFSMKPNKILILSSLNLPNVPVLALVVALATENPVALHPSLSVLAALLPLTSAAHARLLIKRMTHQIKQSKATRDLGYKFSYCFARVISHRFVIMNFFLALCLLCTAFICASRFHTYQEDEGNLLWDYETMSFYELPNVDFGGEDEIAGSPTNGYNPHESYLSSHFSSDHLLDEPIPVKDYETLLAITRKLYDDEDESSSFE